MTGKAEQKEAGVLERAKNKPMEAVLEWQEDGTLEIEVVGDFSRFATATNNANVANGIIGQLAVIGSHGNRVDEKATNFALGFVDTMKPRDAAEVLLTTQMAAIHQATMMLARRFNHVENLPQQDAAERALNKLARTFAAQMDTLKRYRSKGQQTVRVERVTVEEGGQAIVGAVQGRGG